MFLFLEILAVLIELTLFKILLENYRFFIFTTSGYICILSHFLFFILSFSFYFPFVHILSLSNVVITTFLKCLHAKAHLNARFLWSVKQSFDWTKIVKFRQYQTELLQLVTQLNTFSCKLIFSYFFLNIPINAYFSVLLLQGKVTGGSAFIISAFCLSQINGIMAIHLFAALLSSAIHKPGKVLLSIACQINGNLAKLQAEHIIEAWHTKNPYGLMYGKCWLCSKMKNK